MESGSHVEQASNCMNVTNYDKSNWLFLSCTRLMDTIKTRDKENLAPLWTHLENVIFNQHKTMNKIVIIMHGAADAEGSEIRILKERLDYLLKPLMLQLGSFLDICQCLSMISKTANKCSDMMFKFVVYYHYFDEDSNGGSGVTGVAKWKKTKSNAITTRTGKSDISSGKSSNVQNDKHGTSY